MFNKVIHDKSIVINEGNSYKIGLDEVIGLEEKLKAVLKPIVKALKKNMYWTDSELLKNVEYKSRDGFIAHSHNCGGIMICEVIPECESYDFDFLDFGQPTSEELDCEEGYNFDGELDAILRIWLKFEGFDDKGNMKFYIFLEGGNNDAPYFRQGRQSTLYEGEFKAKKLSQIKDKAAPHIKKLLKILEGK